MIRDDVLMKLVDLTMSDDGFRERARTDLDGALRDSGVELNAEELMAVRDFRATVEGLSDSDLREMFSEDGRRQFAS